jgi:hypothetical protein
MHNLEFGAKDLFAIILVCGVDHWSGSQLSCIPAAVLQGVITEEGE